MPTYEYRCPKGHTFEVFQKMSDPPVATCTHCSEPAERVLSGGAGFLFKGEGFYITDSRSEDYKKKAEADKRPGEGKPSEGGAGKTEKTEKTEKADKKAEPAATSDAKPKARKGSSSGSGSGSGSSGGEG